MQWASAVSEEASLEHAVEACAAAVRRELAGAPDLVVAFVSEHHADDYDLLPRLIDGAVRPRHWLGCSAGGVIGAGQEVERSVGFSLTAACLPDACLRPFQLEPGAAAVVRPNADSWRALTGASPRQGVGFLLLADPFSFEAETCIRGLDAIYPEAPKAGGLASGGRQPGGNVLYVDGQALREGAVGLALTGDVELGTVVAQGCRPIGQPMFVTRCEGNVLQALDGRSPYELLADLYESLSPRDRELFQHSLFLGIVMDAEQQQYGQGDFLVRNIVGLDPKAGFLAIGAPLREHMVVQFHLRDAETSRDDLDAMLARYRREGCLEPQGALMFSCLGRGRFLYGRANHDTEIFRRHLGPVPLGGFFCNGEIGPVHGRTFLHGYTSSFALFRRRGR